MTPSQDDIDAQRKLLIEHRRTLAYLLTQQAMHSPGFTPPAIIHGIREARDSIQRIKAALQNWGILTEDMPDDKEERQPQTIINKDSVTEQN